jgi:hypothetical protein
VNLEGTELDIARHPALRQWVLLAVR